MYNGINEKELLKNQRVKNSEYPRQYEKEFCV